MSTFDVPSSQQEPDRIGELCDVIAKQRRRHVLYSLRDADEATVAVERLVQSLVERTGDETARVEQRLHHVSLPKLVAAGVIEHDRRSGCVRYRPTRLLEQLLEQVSALEERD
ncbi:hypothetical protein C5B90_12080 [Haloferax sp. Atlit-12N]|uniref:DUF7344 domain-containing protein n=1 Tax=Haloferax sp. Atlit-12N TaxID=2077203 RepID=UPI000E2579B9|nr:hypothetical protein [Haloferax sp. Atlit-12N]RDZ63849.1 hypothetical protein C5B90_12080 [Haloferax sp. Atlit-12N]